ncbi:MAG: tyrosine-type recombinase/integrase [Sporocytophaga sp.]|uniref:tyrosine-type recombinase/integrase n=1 Tax=Sporocytophaga sp. TaxID=2231183 RepID=UPI001B087BA0|nr:tyrosine-type recombinase/integrase [Sporocytophaga sp.]MBO9701715.1 tyrosine-type recombinase/integrase [Sporocytophaga sp.]
MSKKGLKTTCSYIEWDTLLNLIDDLKEEGNLRMCLYISIASHVGMRAGDILRLKWKDLLHKEMFFWKEKKTGKDRTIIINSKLRSIIHLVAQKKDAYSKMEDYVFSNRTGLKPISIQYLNRNLDRIFKLYNVPISGNGSSHCLRKSFARRAYFKLGENEYGLMLIQEVLGHTSIACTRRYLGLRQEEINDVYLQL